jgi:hypothetical protein
MEVFLFSGYNKGMKKISKNQIRIMIAAVIVLVIAGLASWALISYQNEQARLRQLRVEAANRQIASKAVKETYDSFFDRLRKITPTSGSFKVVDFINSSDGKHISQAIKDESVKDKSSFLDINCRMKFSDKLEAEGYTFGEPKKRAENLYSVSVTWAGDKDDSSDRPSVGRVDVDTQKRKIVKFDCSEQDAIDKARQENASAEMKAR